MIGGALLERPPMEPKRRTGRPKTSTREDLTVKVDRHVIARARFVADTRKLTLAEYLTEALRPVVDRDFEKAARGGQGESAKGGKP